MRKTMLKRTLALVLCASFVVSFPGNASAKTVTNEDVKEYIYTSDEFITEMISNNYTQVSMKYTAPIYSGADVIQDIETIYKEGNGDLLADKKLYKVTEVKSESSKLDKGDLITEIPDASEATVEEVASIENGLLMEIDDVVTLTVKFPETARYYVNFNYISADDSILPIQFGMKVDGEYPFYETRQIEFETTWVDTTNGTTDRYGNEIITMPSKLIQWEKKYLMDASYRYSTPLELQLTAGEHTFEIAVNEGKFVLGDIVFEKVTEVPEYTGSEKAEGDQIITLNGEKFTYRNDSAIHGIAEFESGIFPYEVKHSKLNTIDADSFKSAGQRVEYEFTVEKTGWYYIATNYRQSDKNGFPIFMDIKIDGKLPNKEFSSYAFAQSTGYSTKALTDADGKKMAVYLEEGKHLISYTITLDNIRYILEATDRIMNGINDLSLEITKMAGSNNDKWRDINIKEYIPDIEERLNGWVEELRALEKSARIYTDGEKVAALSSLNIAADILESLAEDYDEIAFRTAELTGTNSANQYLANMNDTMLANKIAIDRIYIYQEDAKLPEKEGFFTGLWNSIQRFIYSFTNQAYAAGDGDSESIQVWVNWPKSYLEIMQKMIDEEGGFTDQTGIKVELSLMPDANKLVLANASGDSPDVATGLNYALPFELAVRGALVDMTKFDDFNEVAKQYSAGLHIPATIGESIYAMPETMNFWVLFYRTDIFEKLGLDTPDTIEDVQDLASELQIRGLGFYYPTAGMTAMRNFHGTTPILLQMGASLYNEDGSCALGSQASVDGFTTLTDLFTIYNLDVDVPSFYQHFRNGDMPIGIGDYAMYNLVKNAAPEIANSWDIQVIPGIDGDGDGEIERYVAGGGTSAIMFHTNDEREQQAWEYVKWWSSADVQSEFGTRLQVMYGSEFIWNTANIDAFEDLPWATADKKVILEQAHWVLEVPRIPGTYMLERELSNAFVDVVVNGDELRARVDQAVTDIDRETLRKMKEFGYIDADGNCTYKIPTLDSVKEIIGYED